MQVCLCLFLGEVVAFPEQPRFLSPRLSLFPAPFEQTRPFAESRCLIPPSAESQPPVNWFCPSLCIPLNEKMPHMKF